MIIGGQCQWRQKNCLELSDGPYDDDDDDDDYYDNNNDDDII